jgi:sugar lactone lactonase YvrE
MGNTKRTFLVTLLISSVSFGLSSQESDWSIETVIEPAPFQGIHGITFDQENRLIVGSVVGSKTYLVNAETGETSIYIAPPLGMADDMDQYKDGLYVWTAYLDGKVYGKYPDGEIITLAEDLIGINSIAFKDDGRLFATQVFLGDALYELDPKGKKPPRLIMENMGGLNGFDFGKDGFLYGPLWFKGQVVKIDVDKASIEVISSDFQVPAAVNFNSKEELFVVDTRAGEVIKLDQNTGSKLVISKVNPAIDNLAFDKDDRLYITNMSDNSVLEILNGGSTRTVTTSHLSTAADIAIAVIEGRETLVIADTFGVVNVDIKTALPVKFARVWSDPIAYPLHVSAAHGKLLFTSWSEQAATTYDIESETYGETHKNIGAAYGGRVLKDGSVLLIDHLTGKLTKYSENFKKKEIIFDDLGNPGGMVFVNDNFLYITDYTSGKVLALDILKGTKQIIKENLLNPEGLAILLNGDLVIAEVGKKRIITVNIKTKKLEVLASNLPIGEKGPAAFPPIGLPTGIAVSSDQDIYFTSDINTALYKLSKN